MDNLPPELKSKIMKKLNDPRDVRRLGQTNKVFKALADREIEHRQRRVMENFRPMAVNSEQSPAVNAFIQRQIDREERRKQQQQGQGRRKPNPWMIHVKKVKAQHPNMQLKEVLKLASASYKK